MKNTFHIAVYQNSDCVHLKLFGCFDDLSALELSELVDRFNGNVGKVIIHTGALDHVSSAGTSVFHRRVVAAAKNLIATGSYADQFLPSKKQFDYAG